MRHLILITVLSFISFTAKSEYCWKIDCSGYVGYIYIPSIAIGGTKKLNIVRDERDEYRVSNKEDLPFVEMVDGLPDVNEIVTISGDFTGFEWNSKIPKIADKLKNHKDVEYIKDTKEARIKVFRDSGFPMQSGAKVKILGYK